MVTGGLSFTASVLFVPLREVQCHDTPPRCCGPRMPTNQLKYLSSMEIIGLEENSRLFYSTSVHPCPIILMRRL